MVVCVRATVFSVIQLGTSTDKHRCVNVTLPRRVTKISHFNGLNILHVQKHLRRAKLNSVTQYKNFYQLLPPLVTPWA